MSESLRQYLSRNVVGIGSMAALGKFLSLMTAILLARAMGPIGFGYYTFAVAAIGLVAIPSQLGLPQLLTREAAASFAQNDWPQLQSLMHWAVRLGCLATIVSSAMFGWALLGFAEDFDSFDPSTLLLSLMLLPMIVSKALTIGFLRGLRQVLHASWPTSVLTPSLLLIFIVLLDSQDLLLPPTAMAANVVATAVAAIVSLTILKRYWPSKTWFGRRKGPNKQWLGSLVPFSLIAGMNVINLKADILLLGVFSEAEDVGVYSAAIQGGMLVSFSLSAFNAVLGTNVARLRARGEHQLLQRLISVSTTAMALVAGFTVCVLLVFGQTLIADVFGDSFVRGFDAMAVLAIGQLFNAAMGPVGLFLSMCGYEKDALNALSISAVMNVALNILLIPPYGITGAAFATSSSLVFCNVLLGIWLYRRVRIIPGPFMAGHTNTS